MAKQFGETSTTDEVLAGVDLKGKRFLVTGVSSGLGVETARVLVTHGAEVVGAARDLAKAEGATVQVRAEAKAHGGRFELIELDLASLKSVRVCADRLLAAGKAFDVIIANAGVMAAPFGHTADGFETQFGTNHLGHFVLVNRIASLLKAGGRLVNLASSGHRFSNVSIDDPGFEKTPYDPWAAYGRSKTANVLFAVEADRRHQSEGIRAFALHPGAILETDLARNYDPEELKRVVERALRIGSFKTVEQGAATTIFCATSPLLDGLGGVYCENCDVAPIKNEGDNGVRPYAIDPDAAKRLWAWTERFI